MEAKSVSRRVRVTVCELQLDGDGPAPELSSPATDRVRPPQDAFENQWRGLVDHAQTQKSQLVLLPELFCSRWFVHHKQDSGEVWKLSIDDHNAWIESHLKDFGNRFVLGSRPILDSSAAAAINTGNGDKAQRFHQAFVWHRSFGLKPVHVKRYLPEEDGFFEASWYARGDGSFDSFEIDLNLASDAPVAPDSPPNLCRLGFSMCSELWFFQHAREYGKQGCHIVLSPRSTESAATWLNGGRTTAVVSGAYSLSSNRRHVDGRYTGSGWIVGPDGDFHKTPEELTTSLERPFLTIEIDLTAAEAAKKTYPRYVIDD